MFTLSLFDTRRALLEKKFSSVELTKCFLDRIEKFRNLNAYITVCEERALDAAKESDKKIANGTYGELEGIPLAIKDLFLTKGVRTTAGSKMLYNFVPPYESTVTQKLLDAGAVFLGKTNMDEFAMGSANITSHYGNVINPWHIERKLTPGGSSGGSAAAVAAHLCVAATGSDTGGSIRQPASFVGCVGLKPTYGRCSRYGMVAFASSLDQAGPMTKTVKDAAIFLKSMCGYDVKDPTSANVPVEDFVSFAGKSVGGLKVGIPKEFYMKGMQPEVIEYLNLTIKMLTEDKADLRDVSLPNAKYALPAYYIIAPAEASANLSRYDGVRYGFRADGKDLIEMYENTRGEGFGDEVKRRILIGTYVLSAGYYDAYYMRALKIQKLIKQDFMNVFKEVDVILAPTTPTTSFPIGEEPKDPVTMYLNDIFTVTANIAGLPAISVPVGLDNEGRPVGVQVIAPPFREDLLIQVASAIEAKAAFSMLDEVQHG